MVNFNKTQTIKFHHIKKEIVAIFQMLLILIMNINLHLHPNSNYGQLNVKCAFLRDKKYILLLLHIYIYIYMGVYKYNMGGAQITICVRRGGT